MSVKTVADKRNTTNLVVTTHRTTSPFDGISDLDNFPLEACVELNRRLFTSISSPHRGGPPLVSPKTRHPIRG